MNLKIVATAGSMAVLTVLTVLPALALAQHAQGGRGHPMHGDHPAPAGGKADQAIEIAVTSAGFSPSSLRVKRGQQVTLVVTRKTERTCATEIVIKDAGIHQQLPLNQPVTVAITPLKSGQLRYACGMDMVSGVIVVE